MTRSPDQGPDGTEAAEPAAEPAEPTAAPRPGLLARLGERFRIPLGILVALIGAILAVVFAIRPLDADLGSRGLLTQGAGVALWLCVVGVGVTWALDTHRRITNACLLGAVACYVVFWLSGR